jgi:putative MATE family efflux protein
LTTLADRGERQTANPITTPRTVTATPAAPSVARGAARTRLLLEGPIGRTLLRLAAPNVVVNVVLIAVTASVDAHFVGQLGSGPLAGLSLVFPLLMLMQQMANSSMGGATASAIARAIGSGRREDASSLVVHALVIACVMAGIFTSAFLVAGPTLYGLMGGEGQALAAAIEYSNAIFAGALAYWLLSALTSVVRGTGQPTVLAIVYVAAEILHVLLVPLLVFGIGPLPSLGVTGAGVATVTSFTVSAAFLAWYVASGRTPLTLSWRAVRLERRFFTEILRVGGPMSLQPVLNNVSLATLTAFVGMSGPLALAAFGAAVRLEYVLYPLTFGLGAGVLAMVGTNIGAGQGARAARIAWTAGALGAGFTACVGLVGIVWPGLWIGFFSTSTEVLAMATSYLCIAGLAYPFLGLGLPLSSALQAAGRPLWPLLGITSRVVVVAVGGWVVVHMTDTGLLGLAVVTALGLVAYGSTVALAFGKGNWGSRHGL